MRFKGYLYSNSLKIKTVKNTIYIYNNLKGISN